MTDNVIDLTEVRDRRREFQSGLLDDEEHYECSICGEITQGLLILRAAHPFTPGEIVVGCPTCLCMGDFTHLRRAGAAPC